jgi:hypothetical protein
MISWLIGKLESQAFHMLLDERRKVSVLYFVMKRQEEFITKLITENMLSGGKGYNEDEYVSIEELKRQYYEL